MTAAARDDRGWRGVVESERTLFDAAEEPPLAPATIEARFVRFDRDHPEVREKLTEYALELVRHGWAHFGISLCYERVRYETMLGSTPEDGTPFKLDDAFRSRYARLLAETVPDLAEVFELRRLRSAARLPGHCGACEDGHCRNCLGPACAHECDVEELLA